MADIKVTPSYHYNAEKAADLYKNVFFIIDAKESIHSIVGDEKLCQMVLQINNNDLNMIKLATESLNTTSKEQCSSVELLAPSNTLTLRRFVVIYLPQYYSRTNAPSRCHALASCIQKTKSVDNALFVIIPSKIEHAYPLACAVGRQFPIFCMKSGFSPPSKLEIVIHSTSTAELDLIASDAFLTINNIRVVQKLVDTPPNLLHSDAYVQECMQNALLLNCGIKVIGGKELEAQGFGGIWGVGKASEHLPALVIMSYVPEGVTSDVKSICLVGKGIMYDTGGLSIKTPTTYMTGMKTDMGGSAAVFGAFTTLVQSHQKQGGNVLKQPLHALLCIAENSVGPLSTRPDDIHVMLSGKTVEINNTDCEGRLVLADGCFYASKYLDPEYIVDIATLTGAQLIATGKHHAAIYCSDDELETAAVTVGKLSGDLVYPILYCPEFHKSEFKSSVADFKNCVADRMNAQSSCAAQFIGNNIEDYIQGGGKWLHVDMAGPCSVGEDATGYGVALLFRLAKYLQK